VPLFTVSYSQTVIAEFDLAQGSIDGIQAFPFGDSILLSFSHRDVKKSYWINKEGEKSELKMIIRPGAPLVGIKLHADGTLYYYYLNDIEGQLVLQAFEQRSGTKELNFSRPIFPVPGELLGTHLDKDVLTVVSYLKKEDRLRILTLDGLDILHERFFDIPPDISWHIRSNAGFIAGNEMVDLQQADKKFKLYRERSGVVISIDQDPPGLENKKTTIIRMNVATGTRQVYKLQRRDYDQFVSFYYDDKVYQLSHSPKKYFRCDAFDLTSGKILFSKMFQKDKSTKEQKVIVHRGKSVEVGYSSLYEMLTMSEMPAPSIVVQTTPDSTQLRLILGAVHYYEEMIFIPFFIPLLDPSLLITLFIMPENSNVRYFTLAGNIETGFNVYPLENNPAPTIRQRIDQYEISQTSGKAKGVTGWDLLFKGYAESNDGVLGIYKMKGKKIMLVKYP
jgi:hypothetical protein